MIDKTAGIIYPRIDHMANLLPPITYRLMVIFFSEISGISD